MFALFPFFRRPQPAAGGQASYAWALSQAKAHFPSRYNSPSTTDEHRRQKFEPIALFTALAVNIQQQHKAHAAARSTVEVMLENFDDAMRESGVGDLSVAKKIRTLAAAFNGRLQAYQPCFNPQNLSKLEDALTRNKFGTKSDIQTAVRTIETLLIQQNWPFLTPQEIQNSALVTNHRYSFQLGVKKIVSVA